VLATLVGSLVVVSNTVLPECFALAFKDHLITAHGFVGGWTIRNNNTAATCPP